MWDVDAAREMIERVATGKTIAGVDLAETSLVEGLEFEELTLRFSDGSTLTLTAEEFVPQP